MTGPWGGPISGVEEGWQVDSCSVGMEFKVRRQAQGEQAGLSRREGRKEAGLREDGIFKL